MRGLRLNEHDKMNFNASCLSGNEGNGYFYFSFAAQDFPVLNGADHLSSDHKINLSYLSWRTFTSNSDKL
jgi:hypothetical protein